MMPGWLSHDKFFRKVNAKVLSMGELARVLHAFGLRHLEKQPTQLYNAHDTYHGRTSWGHDLIKAEPSAYALAAPCDLPGED